MSTAPATKAGFVLASKSASRRAMLDQAGAAYECVPADIDEREIEARLMRSAPSIVALALAKAKARHVGEALRGSIVLGSDSLVNVAGKRFDKPETRGQAADHLRFFSGKVLELHSAAALWKPRAPGETEGRIVWSHADLARLHVRALSDEFIERYLDAEWPAVSGCVGVFRIEALGVQLFERIEGDYFTILGMPLLSVLQALRENGALAG